ncbi:MAG: glycosyltransferase [Chloroflexi bacterium]|nr:glycosyltransferase [Chloroflexota bacterium]
MTDQVAMTVGHTFQDYATKRISYVLPTRNKAQFIGKALEIAKRLVGPEDELIVVDGGSTDGTAEIVASYGDLVDVFISEPDLSPSHASNKGMLTARGRYIKWLTDDDEFFPEAMEQAVGPFFAAHGDPGSPATMGKSIIHGSPSASNSMRAM